MDILQKKSLEKAYEVIKLLRKKEGGTRDRTQRDSALLFLDEFSKETVLSRKKGSILLNQR